MLAARSHPDLVKMHRSVRVRITFTSQSVFLGSAGCDSHVKTMSFRKYESRLSLRRARVTALTFRARKMFITVCGGMRLIYIAPPHLTSFDFPPEVAPTVKWGSLDAY